MATHTHCTTITLQCHCHGCRILVHVPTSSLPLPLSLCHCTTCRRVTGQLAATVAVLPPGSKPLEIKGEIAPRSYRTSARLERFFCPVCGTSLWEAATDKVFIDTGSIKHVRDADGKLLLRTKEHIFVSSTQDGGLRDMLPVTRSWTEWQDKSDSIPSTQLYGQSITTVASDPNERLQCSCHCNGVRFSISRPNEVSHKAMVRDRLDLIVPHYDDPSKRRNENNEPFWLRGQEQEKYLAGLCVCDDCRTACGQEVQAWSWIPIINIHLESEGADKKGTLTRYKGSDAAWREFCGTCGATAFFGTEDSEGVRELWDVSVGLMQSQVGARAEDWLEWWTERVSYEDSPDNDAFVEMLGKGVRAWAARRAK